MWCHLLTFKQKGLVPEKMNLPTLGEIDEVRLAGLRPTVVACLIYKKKVLLVFKKKYHHWLMPQGGVENGENLQKALLREVKEELGTKFAQQLKSIQPILLTQDSLEFRESDFNARDLISDAGEKLEMQGKYYYFLAVPIVEASLDTRKSEFDQVIWANYHKAQQIIETVYLQNKKIILQKSINFLKEQGLIE